MYGYIEGDTSRQIYGYIEGEMNYQTDISKHRWRDKWTGIRCIEGETNNLLEES